MCVSGGRAETLLCKTSRNHEFEVAGYVVALNVKLTCEALSFSLLIPSFASGESANTDGACTCQLLPTVPIADRQHILHRSGMRAKAQREDVAIGLVSGKVPIVGSR